MLDNKQPESDKLPETRRKRGRPTKYSQKIADRICIELSEGFSLTSICKRLEISYHSVMRWLWEPSDFQKDFCVKYARAREMQAEKMADIITDIADDSSNDEILAPDGRILTNHEAINRSRLRVDARKWIAAHLLPKKFGEKQTIDQNLSGELKIAIKGRK